MTTNTMVAIQTITLGSAQSSVTFGSGGTIPQTYTDLVLIGYAYNTGGGQDGTRVTINGDTGNHYSYTQLYGDGTNATSGRGSNTRADIGALSGTSGQFSVIRLNFMNYSNTTTYKTFVNRLDFPSGQTLASVALWRGFTGSSTEAITSITISAVNAVNLAAGSTFTLYGI